MNDPTTKDKLLTIAIYVFAPPAFIGGLILMYAMFKALITHEI